MLALAGLRQPLYLLTRPVVNSSNVRHISGVRGDTPHHLTNIVPNQSDADAPRPSDGLSVWVTSQRRTGGPLGEKWTGRPFQAVQGMDAL